MEKVKEIKINLRMRTNKRTLEKEFTNIFDLKIFMENFFLSYGMADRRAELATVGYANPERRMRGLKIKTEDTKDVKIDNMGQVYEKDCTTKREIAGSSKSKTQLLIYGSITVFILITFFTLLFKTNEKAMSNDLTHTEARDIMFEEKFSRLTDELIELKQSLSKLNESQRPPIRQLDELSQRFDKLEKKITLVDMDNKASFTVPKKSLSKTHNLYHEVRSGETLFRIAKEYNMTVDQLCSLNKITPTTLIHIGQKLLVSK